MKSVSTLIAICAALSAITASADDQARTESRTAYTNNDAVVAVGNCSYPLRYTDLLNNERMKSEFSVTTCKEIKHYQASVTGSSWNTHETALSGTETYTYQMASDTKSSDQIYNANDAFQSLNVLNACNSMRDGFVQAERASQGRSKCGQ